ncbi:MAG: hypothetical protein KUA37_05120 [Desulfomicrobium sp.]|nr:hypothetical protein [Pseudomonadota bacterium]MBV1711371.1 hypothetical protein [Desulfomicrobium sp.]MBU4570773.1 hypothetical protein [Pseudomonadota bacterium]MBU4595262.1 hypothetical protein [Pseudomonadota bacterium]MBV1720695.1 hypothetical protein [Desulfomicrobium sp.]
MTKPRQFKNISETILPGYAQHIELGNVLDGEQEIAKQIMFGRTGVLIVDNMAVFRLLQKRSDYGMTASPGIALLDDKFQVFNAGLLCPHGQPLVLPSKFVPQSENAIRNLPILFDISFIKQYCRQ